MNTDNELQAKLKSKNPADRMLAVMRLGESQTGARAAFLHLVESLKDQDFGVRTSAASALVRAGADAVPHLEKLLNDPHRLVRVNGACNLLRIQSHAGALAVVTDALRPDQDDKIKRNTFYDLSNMGPAAITALPAILQALDDPSHAFRERAFDVLQILGPLASAAVPKLMELWRKKQNRAEVVFTLGCMGPAAANAVPLLIEALHEKGTAMQGCAATALGDIGPEAREAIPDLVKVLSSGKGDVPGRAAETLTKLGPPVEGAGKGLLKLLEHKTIGVRLTAARALALLEPGKAKKAFSVLKKDYKKHEFDRDEIAEIARMIDADTAKKHGLV